VAGIEAIEMSAMIHDVVMGGSDPAQETITRNRLPMLILRKK
jgi:hypothetical protein